ncbi:MAG TPA: transketolase [Rhabdochlamydiaceae bacterium]|nr:transketolase [Rhabdochlamydiaceae bacterium]
MLQKIANTIRHLTMDAVEFAGSGHPGLPMGCAEIGAYLYGEFLRFDPRFPKWPGRDRMILSAGHGSLLLYSCLHLAGFSISIEDLKQFRQIDSKTPSHPDLTKTEGVEATTGVDGQGVGFAVGQALALKIANFEAKVVCLAGDGCLMEGISSEACSLAGHLQLNNLILIYDSNKTTLDGYVDESFSENVNLRFKAQGWNVKEIDGHDLEQIRAALAPLRNHQTVPTLIIAHTKIGYGSQKAGTPAVHGKPLGKTEIALAKQRLGLPDLSFYVDPEVYAFFQTRAHAGHTSLITPLPTNFEQILQNIPITAPVATRWAAHQVLQALADHIPSLITGSADLSSSDGTYLTKFPSIQAGHFQGRNIKYGVREFGMGCLAAGMAQTGFVLPVVGTFLSFVDYMRSAIRMTSLMRLKVIYQLTHDSIFIGHDGPTHQPIEQIASLRAIPGLLVLRPADIHEVKMAYLAALLHEGPSALILSRQPLPELPLRPFVEGVGRGAYIVQKEVGDTPSHLLIATGSEVHLALEVAKALGPQTRVVSMPSWELFDQQPDSYKAALLQGKMKLSIEAGVEQGWHKYIGADGLAIALSAFGKSGSPRDLAERFGFTKEAILEKIQKFS